MKRPAFLTKKDAPAPPPPPPPPVKTTFTISGHIKAAIDPIPVTPTKDGPLAGVLILLNAPTASHEIKTNAEGFYTTQSVSPGTYTVIPRLKGYVFDPISRRVDVDRDLPGIDFIGMKRP